APGGWFRCHPRREALEECPLCLLPQPPEAFPSLASCSHRSCWTCMEQYLRLAVRESRVPVSCPHCPAALQPADVHRLLPEPLHLPSPHSYAVFAHGCAECPRLTCGREGCGTEFCYHCRQPWHPDGPCAPAPSLASPTAEDIKVCPRCSAFIMKINDGSCNRMNCTVCGCLFCWLCLREISDVHFLRSVQGCEGWEHSQELQWGQPGPAPGVLLSLFVSPIITALTVGECRGHGERGCGCGGCLAPRVAGMGLGSDPPLSTHRCWGAPGAHLRVWDRGAVAVPDPLGLPGQPRARRPRRGGAGQPGQT
uniref:RBR-type E3 ubiquitin transferase n=1 Tax=Cyanoderma ruficeps TaxID=181631 RepID=A0A8C3RHD3_9PASS